MTNKNKNKPEQNPEQKKSGWHYTPPIPLSISPFFIWPLRIKAAVQWLWQSWFFISERLIILAIACVSYYWFHPTLEQMKTLNFDWIAMIYLRNLILFFTIAGGLHFYLYIWRKQGDTLRFDARPLVKSGRQFAFNGQVRDNMFWSLVSGVSVWSLYEIGVSYVLANGWIPYIGWGNQPILFVLYFAFIPLWESFYFYWIHRMLHWPPLYRRFHSVHHRNVNVGPWSGLSMHPIEHIIYLGGVLIHGLIGAHPLHIIYHLHYYTLSAASTHSGFEGLVVKDKNRLNLGTFHHQMHHRYFECNYGSLEIPWDVVFGSFHDGTPAAHKKMKARRTGE